MKNLKLFILSLFSTILFAGCNEFDGLFEDLFGENVDSEIKEDVIEYLDEVILLDQYQIDSVQIVNDENINVYTNEDLKSKKFENKIIVYTNENDSRKCFIGRVLNVENKGDFFKINTKIPAMDEVFSELNLCPELNLGISEYSFTPDPNDDVEFCGIVNNDIWESIQVVATDSTEFRTRTTSSEESFSSPIDITLKFASKSSSAFQGNLYYRIKGAIEIRKDCSYEISVHQIIGLDGSFKIASVSTGRKYIPLLTVKNGITLYSNKLVGIRVKPSVNFFYSGEIKLEAGFKYELMNVDTYVAFENGDFYNKSMDNKRDWFFRVKSLKSKASFGMSLNSDFYAFIFSDNFFQGGVQAAAGLEISGESNVGIQFPDVANFDFKVGVSPFLEVKPYAAVRLPNLKRIEGPTMSVKTSRFSKSLIPNFHDMNYKKANRKLHYDAIVASFEDSFVDAPECGIALFEKGKEEPISYGALKQSATRSSTQNNTFSISNGVVYEIAPYVKTFSDGTIIGERIEVPVDERDLLIKLYNETGGDNWIKKDNWCEGNNINEWYGINAGRYIDENYRVGEIRLPNNNLSGLPIVSDFSCLRTLDIRGNNLTGLTISNCKNLDSLNVGDCANLTNLNIQDSEISTLITKGSQIRNVNIKNSAFQWNRSYSINFEGLQSLEVFEVMNTDVNFECINLKNNQNLKTVSFEECDMGDVLFDGSIVKNVIIKDCKNLDPGYGFDGFNGGSFDYILIENSMEGMGQSFFSDWDQEPIKVTKMEFKDIDNLGRIFFNNVIANEISFYDCHFSSQGISVDYGSSVTKLSVSNCTIPTGRIGGVNTTTYLTNSTIGNWWAADGYFVISNCTIEGMHISSFSGSDDDVYDYLWEKLEGK